MKKLMPTKMISIGLWLAISHPKLLRGPNAWRATTSGNIEADVFRNTKINKYSARSGSIGLLKLRVHEG